MLVLSRKVGESIHIGTNIILTVVEIRGDQVRLRVTAPNDVKVLRGELVGKEVSDAGGEKAES